VGPDPVDEALSRQPDGQLSRGVTHERLINLQVSVAMIFYVQFVVATSVTQRPGKQVVFV